MPSAIDARRLRDGAAALSASSVLPTTADEVLVQMDAVGDGIAALQSLDDLGPQANEAAHRDAQELWKRLRVLTALLKELTK